MGIQLFNMQLGTSHPIIYVYRDGLQIPNRYDIAYSVPSTRYVSLKGVPFASNFTPTRVSMRLYLRHPDLGAHIKYYGV